MTKIARQSVIDGHMGLTPSSTVSSACSGYTSGANTISLYQSDGGSPPSFTAVNVSVFASNTLPTGVAAAFIDSDSCMDVVSGTSTTNTISWHQSDCASTPSFTQHVVVTNAAGSNSVQTADLNGDSAVDIISANHVSGSSSITYYLSSGGASPTFTAFVLTGTATTTAIITATIVDVNSDGFLDILVPLYGGTTVSWYESDGALTPSFTQHTISSVTGSAPVQSVATDMDGDGFLDVAVAVSTAGTVVWYQSSGGSRPTFTGSVVYGSVNQSWGLAPADVDGDGRDDLVTTDRTGAGGAGLTRWHQNSGTSPPTFTTWTIGNSTGAVYVAAVDLNSDRLIDVAVTTSTVGGTQVVWYQNNACTPGQYSGSGNQPCAPCPAGTFGSVIGLASSVCSGYCAAGQFSVGGATSCTLCPPDRFGNATGLTTSLCSGPCVAASGSGCDTPGGTSSTGTGCAVGRYSSGGACVPCPIGTFGNTTALFTAACSGVCAAVPGSFCGAGATAAFGALCPPGQYSDGNDTVACSPCPMGRYGDSNGVSTSVCSGVCTAPPGSYCPLGATTPTGFVCPKGSFSTGGAGCSPCPAGRYGGVANLTSAACSGSCDVGKYSYAGAVVCTLCVASSSCTSVCSAAAGSYCNNGTVTVCPKGYYSATGSARFFDTLFCKHL